MKKIPTIFLRDPENMKLVTSEPNPEAQWVFDGEGVATYKYDGTCCMMQGGVLYRRYELREGKKSPENFEVVDERVDFSGKKRWTGWVPVGDDPNDRYHREALENVGDIPDGTYELVGPKVQGNPERLTLHLLVPHDDAEIYDDVTRTFEGLRAFLESFDGEGLVFHHPDGRMAKIKRRDYGY